jgi:hypothetical protein
MAGGHSCFYATAAEVISDNGSTELRGESRSMAAKAVGASAKGHFTRGMLAAVLADAHVRDSR